jgi:segregation and condensation protein B
LTEIVVKKIVLLYPNFVKKEMIKKLSLHIESLIFASEKPITIEDITSSIEETLELLLNPGDIDAAIEEVKTRYSSDDFAIEVVEISGGYSFMTKGAYHLTISNYLKQTTNKKLSKAALETLSIVAYKQPVSKTEIESIRGVNCDYAIQKLLDKELVEIRGRSESVGKPLLYGTSEKFFDYFGLKGIQDLPKLKDFEMPDNTIGDPGSEEVESVMLDGVSQAPMNANVDESQEMFAEVDGDKMVDYEDEETNIDEVMNFEDEEITLTIKGKHRRRVNTEEE